MTDEQFKAAFSKITPHGWLTEEEGRLLVKYAEMTKGAIVEVGCYQGRSAMLLAQLGRELHCIDPWDDKFSTDLLGEQIYNRFCENIRGLIKNVGDSIRVISHRLPVEIWTPIKAGLVYLDGDHTYEGTRNQLYKAADCDPLVIAIHDVNDDGEGAEIKRAALEHMGESWTERVDRLAVWVLPENT